MKSTVADYKYRVLCVRIVPITGSTIYLTSYPRNLTMDNGDVYISGSGYEGTAYTAASNLSPAMVDLEGICEIAGISRDQVADSLYDGASVYLFATTWSNPIHDEEPITRAILGKTQLIDNRYRIEEMSLIDVLNQSVGSTFTPTCQKEFCGQGFAGCKLDIATYTFTGTITSVTDIYTLRDSSRTEDADYFTAGIITMTSGDNAGLKGQEVKTHLADGTFTLFENFYYPVQVGDTYSVVAGCRKRLEDCRDKFNNVNNFGGFSFVPTGKTYTQHGY